MAGLGTYRVVAVSAQLLFLAACGGGTSLNDGSTPAVSPAPPSPLKSVYIGVSSTTNTASYVYKYTYDADAGSLSDVGSSSLSGYGTGLRALAVGSGGLLTANVNTTAGNWLSLGLVLGSSFSYTGGGGNALGDNHAFCELPNGNIIVGDELAANTNNLNEYSSAGAFLRNISVVTGSAGMHPALVECHAPSSTTLFSAEGEAWTGAKGFLRRYDYSGSAWSLTSSFSMAAWDALQGTTNSGVWAMAYHTDGYVYMATHVYNASQYKKLVRCPTSNLTASNCQVVGSNLPTPAGQYIYDLMQVPNSNDMLILYRQGLYRFNYGSQSVSLLRDLTSIAPGGGDNARSLAIVQN